MGRRAFLEALVAPREGRVSRNVIGRVIKIKTEVAPREGRVSRNEEPYPDRRRKAGRAPRGACE